VYRLVSKERRDRSVVSVAGRVRIGEGGFTVIAGPCAVESREQIERTAAHVARKGATMLRGGAYKPRTSPYSFQGLGDAGVEMIARASSACGIPAVVEALSERELPLLAQRVAMIQIGARNMQNFALLRAVAKAGLPILLKRGPAATLDELLYAAEYIVLEGNEQIVLCERGVRGFDPHTRNLLDLAGALRLKELTHLPVIVDPSHATGRRSLVGPLAVAAAAAGLDGVMVEVHPEPETARSDAEQALDFAMFDAMMEAIARTGRLPAGKVSVAACR
jgi:3-deoxy-7-phosphoheptulonate synthase